MKHRGNRRYKTRASIRELRATDKQYQEGIRTCCQTSRKDPHATGCQRGYRQCGDKVAFPDRARAVKRAAALSKEKGEAWNAYRCSQCRQHHIGHAAL